MDSRATEQTDGRTVRAQRTRQALVDALFTLLEEGELRPTGERIAERAGVSERSVFQHFPDRESLFEAVALQQWERVVTGTVPVDASLPLDERIEAFASQRCAVLEQVTPVRTCRAAAGERIGGGGELGRDVSARRGRRGRARVPPRARPARAPRARRSACRAGVGRDLAGLGGLSRPPGTGLRAGPGARCAGRLRRYSASADSISAIACAGSAKRIAVMPRARAASQLTSRSSTNTQSLGRTPSPRRSRVSS